MRRKALDAQEAPDDAAPASAGGEGGSRGRAPPAGTSGANRVVVCQVQGCAATQLRPYNIRNRRAPLAGDTALRTTAHASDDERTGVTHTRMPRLLLTRPRGPRLCNDHMRAESLDIDGEARRFCQKCVARGGAAAAHGTVTAAGTLVSRAPCGHACTEHVCCLLRRCNRLHALTAFSGGKRTCARLLADHNARRRATYAARRARDASAEPPALRAGAAGGEEQTAQMQLLQQSLAAMPGAAAIMRANDAAMLQAAVWNALCSSAGAAGGAGAAGAAAALAAAAAAQQQQPARPTATAWPAGLEWLAQLQDPAALAALAAGQAAQAGQAGQTGQVALPPALLATLLAAPPAALAAAAQPQQPQQQPQPPRKT